MAQDIISHIGIAVADLEASIARYQILTGRTVSDIEEVRDQRVRVAMFSPADGPGESGGRIELVAPTSDDSPVGRFIADHGEGLHHLCLYVDDIDAKLRELKAAGVRLIDESPRVGAGGKRIAFVHPGSIGGVLIELEERSAT